MKNLLILIVAIAVFLHFFPQPEVEKLYQEQVESLSSIFSGAGGVSLKLEKVQQDVEAEFATFRKAEKKHAQNITSTRESIIEYYHKHCARNSKRDHTFHADNQKKVCAVFIKYSKYM